MVARTVGNHGGVDSSCKKWRNRYCNCPIMHGRLVSRSQPQDLVKSRDRRTSWGLTAENHPPALSCTETRHRWLELHVIGHGFVWRAPSYHLCPALASHWNCVTLAINLLEGGNGHSCLVLVGHWTVTLIGLWSILCIGQLLQQVSSASGIENCMTSQINENLYVNITSLLVMLWTYY